MEFVSNGEIIHTETLLFALFLLFDERSMLIHSNNMAREYKKRGVLSCQNDAQSLTNHSVLNNSNKRHLNRMSIDL